MSEELEGAIERNRHGSMIRDCPDCDGEIEFLEHIEVWLCGGKSTDHAYPAGHFGEEVDQ